MIEDKPMSEPARFSNDFEEKLPRPSSEPLIDPERELPANAAVSRPLGEFPHEETDYEAAASRAGDAVGKVKERLDDFTDQARETLREFPGRLDEMKRRFKVIQGRTAKRARTAASDLKQTAEFGARRARGRFEFYSREYPIETLAGIAGAAFLLGFALRMWRSRD
jgi:ElaB/YqjD/DUF883 family membrane-anchored ribosome-binding protein